MDYEMFFPYWLREMCEDVQGDFAEPNIPVNQVNEMVVGSMSGAAKILFTVAVRIGDLLEAKVDEFEKRLKDSDYNPVLAAQKNDRLLDRQLFVRCLMWRLIESQVVDTDQLLLRNGFLIVAIRG